MILGRLGGILAVGVMAMAGALHGCTQGNLDGSKEVKEPVEPPIIVQTMPLEKALEAGIDFGGQTLVDVKRLIKKRNETTKAARLVAEELHAGYESIGDPQLINAGGLYASLPVPVSVPLFRELIGSARPLARRLGWQLAAVKPTTKLAHAIDQELTRALSEGEEDALMIPEMANAVRANHLKGSYTLMREALMRKGTEEFALAMAELDSQRASDDFLNYLALAPAEELRQLAMSSVNLYSAIAILRHMEAVPPSPGAANFEHLFAYAVSRNTGLADLAQTVLENYVPHRTELLSQLLAREPAWVQIAYIENARRRMSPKVGLLLNALKANTPESDVVEEINELKF